MTDHVRTLLLNTDAGTCHRVVDPAADAVLALFGLTGVDLSADAAAVDRLMPLVLAPDLAAFRRFFDPRTTPSAPSSVYRQDDASLSAGGLYSRVLGHAGWWTTAELFQAADPAVAAVLQDMRAAAQSGDALYALGTVLLACAYRRLLRQNGEGRRL